MFPEFSMSTQYREKYPGVGFGLTLISGCRNHENPPGFDQYKRKLLRKMRKRETLAEISARIDTYADFFQSFGFVCPLSKDAHFMAEMCAGILVAVTDYDRFDGNLTLDTSAEGEVCAGMGGREFVARENEIVLRDEKEIVCVLCQGADEKTRAREDTNRVLFYAYAVPGIESQYLKAGLTIAAETMAEFGGGKIEGIEVYEPE
jgi:DNA/RNA-binding domain of Phe-tRNA-synthetase-like protein